MSTDLTAFVHASMPLCATLAMRAEEGGRDRVVLALDHDASLCTVGGAIHGGVLMALADSAGATCAYLNLPEGATGTSTIESKTNFFGAAREGVLRATSQPLHVGGTTIVVETAVTCGERLVAKTTQTQIVLRG